MFSHSIFTKPISTKTYYENSIKIMCCCTHCIAAHKSNAVATIGSWSISSPLSGSNLSINSTGQTNVTFSVTCTRVTSTQLVDIYLRLQAYAADGTNKAMHSDVHIKTQDFIYQGALHISNENIHSFDRFK